MLGFFLGLFVTITSQTNGGSATNTIEPPSYLEAMERAIDRVQYIEDEAVIKMGLITLEAVIKNFPESIQELKDREDLRLGLLNCMFTEKTEDTVGPDTRLEAAKLLGLSQLVARSTTELNTQLHSEKMAVNAKKAIEIYATHFKEPIADELRMSLYELKEFDLMRLMALSDEDFKIIDILINEAKSQNRYEWLYGLNSVRAADLVVEDFLKQMNVPEAPTNAVVTLNEAHTVLLTWNDQSIQEFEFEIARRQGVDGPWVPIGKAPNNSTSYQDDFVLPENIEFFYRVRAVGQKPNLTSDFAESAAISYIPPPPPPPPPAEPTPNPEPQPNPNPTEPPANTTPPESNPVPSPEPTPEPTPEPAPGGGKSARISEKSEPLKPRPLFKELASSLLIVVEGKPHAATLDAMLTIIKDGSAATAVFTAERVMKVMDRATFDMSPIITSAGLKMMDALKLRQNEVLRDFSITKPEREEFFNRLKSVTEKMKLNLLKDQ